MNNEVEERENETDIRIIHISDSHIWNRDMRGKRVWKEVFGKPKRITGYLNMKFFRGPKVFSHEVFRRSLSFICEKIQQGECDHMIHTGDLSNMCMEDEFRLVKKIFVEELISKIDQKGGNVVVKKIKMDKNEDLLGFEEFEEDEDKEDTMMRNEIVINEKTNEENEKGVMKDVESNSKKWNISDFVSVVPGNHDLYVKQKEFIFGKYFSDCFDNCLFWKFEKEKKIEVDDFPFFKIIKDRILLIMFNSSGPRKVFICGGQILDQLKKASEIMEAKVKKLVWERNLGIIVALHHSPIQHTHPKVEKYFNLPENEKESLMEFCRTYDVKLVINGHTHKEKISKVGDIIISDGGSVNHQSCSSLKIYHFKGRDLNFIETMNYKDGKFVSTQKLVMDIFKKEGDELEFGSPGDFDFDFI